MRLQPPFVLLVQPQLGGDASVFARELAAVLQMEYRETLGAEPALYCPPRPYPPDLAQQIVPEGRSVYVLEMPKIGEIPAPLAELRLRFPPRQTRLLKLPALSWSEARNGVLRDLPFRLAARMYLAAQGNPGYLEALRESDAALESDVELPVPVHIREQLQFKLTLLTPDARNTLERVSIHPGPVSEDLFLWLSGQRVQQELKRHGWLVFNSQGSLWTVRSEEVRQVIYSTLHPGRRRTYHQQAANYFGELGDPYCAAWHDYMACDKGARAPGDDERVGELAAMAFDSAWAKIAFENWLAGRAGVEPSRETMLDVPRKAVQPGPALRVRPMVGNSEVEQAGELLALRRHPFCMGETQISWRLPSEPVLVRIRAVATAAIRWARASPGEPSRSK